MLAIVVVMMRDRGATVRLFVVCGCALLQVIAASAQIESTLSDGDLIAQSDVIVTGRVTEIATGFDDRTTYTHVTIDLADVLKGWVPERQITIKQLGGRVGDLGHRVPGQARFARGEEVLLFLHARASDLTLSTIALSQGKWTIRRDRTWGQPVASRQVIAAADGGLLAPAEDAHLLRDFVARIRREAAGAPHRPSQDHINVSPREAREAISSIGDPAIDAETDNRPALTMTSSGTATQRPGPPTSLRIISGATTFVSWVAPTTGGEPTSYIIEAGSAPGLSDLAFFSVDPTTHWETPTVPSLLFTFTYVRVRGVNGFGAGPASNEFAFYPDNFGRTPPPPTSLRPMVTGSTVVLNWVAPFIGSISNFSYYIEAGSAPGLTDVAEVFSPGMATTFTATNVAPGVYYVRVRVLTDRRGVPSNEIIVTVGRPSPCFAPPTAPDNFVATVSGATVSLTWTASAGQLDSYVVEYGQAVAVWNRLDTASSATSLQVSDVPAGTYFVRIRGKNTCGLGAPSNEAIPTIS